MKMKSVVNVNSSEQYNKLDDRTKDMSSHHVNDFLFDEPFTTKALSFFAILLCGGKILQMILSFLATEKINLF